MLETFFAASVSFVSTNIDDIFVLMLLFAQNKQKENFRRILIGRYLATAALLAVSFLGAFGLSFVPREYIRFLGFIPILLGIKAFWDSKKDETEDVSPSGSSVIWNSVLITIANGADNIGVYIPLFAGYAAWQMGITVAVFAVMTFFLCVLSVKITNLPMIAKAIDACKHIAVPLIYILLGLYILFF